MAMWTGVLAVVAVPVSILLLDVIPVWRDYRMERVIFIQDKDLNVTVRVTAAGAGFGRSGYGDPPPPPRSLILHEDHGEAASDLQVGPPGIGAPYSFVAADGHVVRGNDFGPGAVRTWLTESVKSGRDAPADEVDGRADDV